MHTEYMLVVVGKLNCYLGCFLKYTLNMVQAAFQVLLRLGCKELPFYKVKVEGEYSYYSIKQLLHELEKK